MKPILIIVLLMFLASCSIKATITDPQNLVYVYEGPKDVEMAIKQGDTEITYSGKSEGFWAGMFKYLMSTAPTVLVTK